MDARLNTISSFKNFKLGKKNLTLIKRKMELKEAIPCFDQIHHIHILDRSGSMSEVISTLMNNVKQVVETMGEKDLLSILWFSGEGQSKVLLKGANKANKQEIDSLLDSIKSTIGCTCFSEPLKLTNEVISDLKALCPNFSVNLFTDGSPVVSGSTSEEIRKIFSELEVMSPQILAFNTIGYTRWADQDLLTRMSNTSEHGRYIFSENIQEYNEIFGKNYKRIQKIGSHRYISEKLLDCEFFYKDANTISYRKDSMDLFTANNFEVTILAPRKIDIEDASEMSDEDFQDSLYQVAYESYYKGNSEQAYQYLVLLGDIKLVTMVSSAFTSKERADTANLLYQAVMNKDQRFVGGHSDNLEESATKFCVFDLLNILSNDVFVPLSDYERIGVKMKDNNNIFQKDKNQEYSGTFEDNLVYASSKANVSVRYCLKGKVKLLATASKRVGLPIEVSSVIFRTQTIIKNGELNTNKLCAYVSNQTLDKIRKRCKYYNISYSDLVTKNFEEKYNDKLYVEFNLSCLPIINRRGTSLNIEDIAQTIKRLNENKAKQKLLRSLLKETVSNAYSEEYNEEQLKVLKDHGIVKGIYGGVEVSKDEDALENLDYYTVRSLEFQQKGWSSIPKVEDSIVKGGKLGTPGFFLKEYNAANDFSNLEKVKETLKAVKEEIKEDMNLLSVARIYKTATGGFWEGLSLIDDNKYEYVSSEDPNLVLIVKTTYESVAYTPDSKDEE